MCSASRDLLARDILTNVQRTGARCMAAGCLHLCSDCSANVPWACYGRACCMLAVCICELLCASHGCGVVSSIEAALVGVR